MPALAHLENNSLLTPNSLYYFLKTWGLTTTLFNFKRNLSESHSTLFQKKEQDRYNQMQCQVSD